MRFFFLIFLSCIAPGILFAAPLVDNGGIIPGSLWFVPSVLVEGQNTEIHTAIYNGDTGDIVGTIQFYDGAYVLGERAFTAPKGLVDVFINWKVTAGAHSIHAKVIEATRVLSNNSREAISFPAEETITLTPTVSKTIPVTENLPQTANDVLGTVTQTQNAIENILPPTVVETAKSVAVSADAVRQSIANTVNDEYTRVSTSLKKEELAAISPTTSEKPSADSLVQNPLKRPITYIYDFLLAVCSFIVSNPIVFYLVLIFLLYYLGRFFISRFT